MTSLIAKLRELIGNDNCIIKYKEFNLLLHEYGYNAIEDALNEIAREPEHDPDTCYLCQLQGVEKPIPKNVNQSYKGVGKKGGK